MFEDYLVLIMECTSILFMLVLSYEAFIENKNKERKTNLCRLCLGLTLLALLVEAESYAFDGDLEMQGLTFVCNTLSFVLGTWIIVAFMFYVTALLNEKKKTSYLHAKIVLGMGIAESIIAIAGAFLGKTFTYVDAVYEPGPWIPFLSMFQMVFIAYLFVYILANRKTLGNHDTGVLLIYMGFTIVTTLMEIIFEDLPSFYFVGQALAMNIIYVEDRARLRTDLESQKQLNDMIMHQNTLLDGLAREYHTVWLIDPDHRLHLYRSTGRSADRDDVQIIGLDVPDYSDAMKGYVKAKVCKEDQARVQDAVKWDTVIKETPETGNYVITYRRKLKDGKTDYHQMCFAKSYDEEKGMNIILAFRSVDEEIRKEKEQQERLEEAYSMAQSASRAKTTFLNNMSHDIRTPMNAIIGYTGLAATHIDNKEIVQDYLTKIGQSSNHLLSLINDVLDMSRIESGKMTLNERAENLSEILHTLRTMVQADISSKQQNFFIDTVDTNDENIICDKLRLNQVLLNILSNSIKYTPAGGTISLRVTEKTVSENGYADYEFQVMDNGIGMSEEFIETIFDPFTRMKTSTVSGIQGTGLGMAITKNIVDMMGGSIEIASKENEGTTVVLNISFKLAEGHKEAEHIPELEGMRGMVIDDDSNTCISVHRMLKDVGMRSEWCTSGKEAVLRTKAALQEGDLFRVYIIDWLMPDMNGVETTRRIRQVVGNEVPIVVLSAYDWSDIEEEAKEAGVTAFISKPLFPSDLHSVLQKCIGKDEDIKKEIPGDSDLAGKKILLVEDNEMNREIAQEILEDAGFIVETAVDGNYAVDKMKQAGKGDYDLILMDIQMPTMDGYEATRQIRKLKNGVQDIPIIAMTANAFEEDKLNALNAGMNEHLAKPFDIDGLKAVLKKYLD